MTESERWELENDLADLLRATGDGRAVHLWPALCETWERIPERDRAALRGRWSIRFTDGAGARVGLDPETVAVGRAVILLGRDLGPGAVGLALAHELAHLFCGHIGEPEPGPVVARHVAGSLTPEVWRAALLSGDWVERSLSSSELDREREAWRQVAAWGFDVPATWRAGTGG